MTTIGWFGREYFCDACSSEIPKEQDEFFVFLLQDENEDQEHFIQLCVKCSIEWIKILNNLECFRYNIDEKYFINIVQSKMKGFLGIDTQSLNSSLLIKKSNTET
jgi:hypothetical protein